MSSLCCAIIASKKESKTQRLARKRCSLRSLRPPPCLREREILDRGLRHQAGEARFLSPLSLLHGLQRPALLDALAVKLHPAALERTSPTRESSQLRRPGRTPSGAWEAGHCAGLSLCERGAQVRQDKRRCQCEVSASPETSKEPWLRRKSFENGGTGFGATQRPQLFSIL